MYENTQLASNGKVNQAHLVEYNTGRHHWVQGAYDDVSKRDGVHKILASCPVESCCEGDSHIVRQRDDHGKPVQFVTNFRTYRYGEREEDYIIDDNKWRKTRTFADTGIL